MRKSQPKQAECCRYPPESQKHRFWGRVRNNTVAERAATNRSLRTTLSLSINHNLPPPQNFGAHPHSITKGESLCNLMKCFFPVVFPVHVSIAPFVPLFGTQFLKFEDKKCTVSNRERAVHCRKSFFVPLFRTAFLKNENKKSCWLLQCDKHRPRKKP